MSSSQQHVKNQEFELNLIKCAKQPGKLRISPHACALRYQEAQTLKRVISRDEFSMTWKAGLERCRTCPEGRFFTKRIKRR